MDIAPRYLAIVGKAIDDKPYATYCGLQIKMAQFFGKDLWGQIRECARLGGAFQIVVPYYSTEASIKLAVGDSLIVDASEETIRCGQTSASLLLAAAKRGAAVYTHSRLHAKIILNESLAIVSSANFSRNSMTLVEAGTLFRNAGELREISQYVNEIVGDARRLDDEELERLCRIKVEPTNVRSSRKPSLAEALEFDRPELEGLVFGVATTGPDLDDEDINAAVEERQIKLPKDWSWAESWDQPGVLERIEGSCEGRLYVEFNVTCDAKGRISTFQGNNHDVRQFCCALRVKGYVISTYSAPLLHAAPIDLSRDENDLALRLSRGLKSSDRTLRNRINTTEGIIALKDLQELYMRGRHLRD